MSNVLMTELLFRDDAYLRESRARVSGLTEEGGVILDRTVFYAQGGGQPGDRGALMLADGRKIAIANALYTPDKQAIIHVVEGESPPLAVGDEIVAALDWELRQKRMRAHTALHLLSVVLPYPVTGGRSAMARGGSISIFQMPAAWSAKPSKPSSTSSSRLTATSARAGSAMRNSTPIQAWSRP